MSWEQLLIQVTVTGGFQTQPWGNLRMSHFEASTLNMTFNATYYLDLDNAITFNTDIVS